MLRAVPAVILAALAAACASGPPRTPVKVIDRALASAGTTGLAQPSRIVATELAFARAAREQGQWTAFREYIAEGGLLHGASGPFPALDWLQRQADPPVAVAWAPRAVWMSCDGTLAVSTGRSRDAEGLFGTFVTVWQRQPGGGEYRWIYDTGAPDDPQPEPEAAAAEGDILVVADTLIRGRVADCRTGAAAPPPPAADTPAGARSGGGASPDGTLRWRWEHQADGTRRLHALYLEDGVWREALDWRRPAGR